MKIIDVLQGSQEWKRARARKVTSSRISAVLSRAKGGKSEGTTRSKYKAQLVAEILTGEPQEAAFASKPTEDGKETEPFARAAYEAATGVYVDQVGIVLHPTIDRYSASPDGLVGTRGMMQIKCPLPHTHIYWMLAGVVPTEHEPQMQSEMDCAERDWSDFVSYCPVLPPALRLFVCRLPRDDKRIQEITAEVNVFLREVDEIIERLTRKAA